MIKIIVLLLNNIHLQIQCVKAFNVVSFVVYLTSVICNVLFFFVWGIFYFIKNVALLTELKSLFNYYDSET